MKKNLLFVTHKDMVTDMPTAAKRIAEFLEITLSESEITKISDYVNFDQMKHRKSSNFQDLVDAFLSDAQKGSADSFKFLRKGTKDSYKEEMSKEYVEKFNKDMVKWKGIMELYPEF